MNERLRRALLQRDLSVESLASECAVDVKTVGRWLTTGRVPHARHRQTASKLLDLDQDFLWPEIRQRSPYLAAPTSEIVGTYSDRASVPRDVWIHLLSTATSNIDMLVFSGTFLAQTNPKIAEMLRGQSEAGVSVRLCFGNPKGSAIAFRDQEEGLSGTLSAKVCASLTYFTGLTELPNIGIRLHDTNLYSSIFRYDDQMLVNPHIWGRPASANPVIHIRSTSDDGMYDKYLDSFCRIWSEASPWRRGLDVAS
jgi:transcriptional regulator with XRE-family HTH domain